MSWAADITRLTTILYLCIYMYMNSNMTTPPPPSQLLESLRQQVRRLEAPRPVADDRVTSTGSAALDELLPRRGLPAGALVEWLAGEPGCGAGALAFRAARQACLGERKLVVLDRQRQFYAPAAAAGGIDLRNLLIVQPANPSDELWAWDQALRCPSVGAVWGRLDEIDPRDFRRLQLAAESGGGLGLLLRPARARGQPSWAEVQWVVQPCSSTAGWRWQVELTRSRGGKCGQTAVVKMDEPAGMASGGNASGVSASHETHPLHPLTPVAHPAIAGR